MTFDVTIPVLDEEATLDEQVRFLHTFLQKNYPDTSQWNIVIADNGSKDATPQIASQLSNELSNVQLVKVPKRGVGLALKTSWGQSSADMVGYMDLDMATDLKHFTEAYQAIENGYDVVYGSRLHKNSKVINRPFKREVASRVFNGILKTYLRVGFSDGMCGFKWLKREAYPSLNEGGAQNDGWFFSTELLTVAEWQGKRIFELPVQWTDDVSSSKVKIWPLAKRYIAAMRELDKKRPK